MYHPCHPNPGPEGIKYKGTHFVTEYLYARTINDRDRSLEYTQVIQETVTSILEFEGRQEDELRRREYIHKLCRATVTRSYGPHFPNNEDIYKLLNCKHPSTRAIETHVRSEPSRERTVSENTLAAAAYLNLGPLIQKLVDEEIPERNTYFGRAALNAIWNRSPETTLSHLRSLPQRCPPKRKLVWVKYDEEHDMWGSSFLLTLLSPEHFHRGKSWYFNYNLQDFYTAAVKKAAGRGHLETLKDLLNAKLSFQKYPTDSLDCRLHSTIVVQAATHGRVKTVKFALGSLLQTSPAEMYLDKEYASLMALKPAIKSGNLENVTLVLEAGASPPRWDILGEAVTKGTLAIAKLLIQHGARANLSSALVEPLYMAVKAGRVELVKLLLANG